MAVTQKLSVKNTEQNRKEYFSWFHSLYIQIFLGFMLLIFLAIGDVRTTDSYFSVSSAN